MIHFLKQKKKYLLFLVLLASKQLTAQNNASFTTTYREGNAVTINVGDYRIIFSEKMSWTYRDIFYKEKMLLIPFGFQQSVIKEKNIPAGADTFLGTGHRKETIEEVTIIATDKKNKSKTYELQSGLEITGAKSFIFHKKSKFVSEFNGLFYDHDARIKVTEDGIEEEYSFKVSGDNLANVSFMYPFMHIFPKTTNSWVVGNNKEVIERGKFLDDKSITLKKDFRFGLFYDSTQNLGTAIIYPEIYKGSENGPKNFFWNRVKDNKHYLQIDPKRNKGEEFSYSALITAFEAGDQPWELKAKSLIDRKLGASIKF